MTDVRSKRGNVKVVRGRGCDESFRAAVDKDGPLSLHELRLETCWFINIFIFCILRKKYFGICMITNIFKHFHKIPY